MNISIELLTELRTWWVFNKYQDKEENLHRDTQADIREQWDGNDYCNGFSDNDLASIAKEWAFKQGYEFVLYLDINSAHIYINKDKVKEYNIIASTEPEAVFTAAHWVLKNKD